MAREISNENIGSENTEQVKTIRYRVKKVMKYVYVLFGVAFILVVVSALSQNSYINKMKDQIKNHEIQLNKFATVDEENYALRSGADALRKDNEKLQKENEELQAQLDDYKVQTEVRLSAVNTLIDAQILYDQKEYEACVESLVAIDTKILDEKAIVVYQVLTDNILRVLDLTALPTPEPVTSVITQDEQPSGDKIPKN